MSGRCAYGRNCSLRERWGQGVGAGMVPESGQRGEEDPVARRQVRVAEVEHASGTETVTEVVPQPAQMSCVVRLGRGGGLDLDADDRAVAAFEDEVDLSLVPVAVVPDGDVALGERRELEEFGEDECLQQAPQGGGHGR